MSNLRSQPQAKYKLLLENASPPVSATRSIVVFVLILSVISATGIAVFLAWESLSSVQETGFLLQMVEIGKNKTLPINKWEYRTYYYGVALRNNMNKTTWTRPIPQSWVPPKSHEESDSQQSAPEPKLVCYYTIPIAKMDLQPQKIDPSLCTHINIGFASVSINSTITNGPGDEEIYRQVVSLKKVNPMLKVLLSVGGMAAVGNGFQVMVSTQFTRSKFINSTLSWLSEFNLDGIDFDWEFPAWQSDILQRYQFTQFLRDFRKEIERRELSVLVTVAVAAPQPIIDQSYDVPAMAEYVDFVNVMCYDYHFYVWYLPVTGLNAPLYTRAGEEGYMHTLNTNFTAWYWLFKGMPAEKIILGLPTYGHSYTLVNELNHGLSAPASGFGIMGKEGFTSYPDICWFLNEGEAAAVFDIETKAPYAFRGREWISYEDKRSLSYKAEFVTNNRFGGAMIFSLNMDDHSGQCSGGRVKFPLTRQAANTLQDDQL